MIYPVGSVIMQTTSTNPGTRFTGTTWVQTSQGRYIVGQTGAQSGGDLVGSTTHSHSFTQPDAHAALSHSGATVGNHTFTQPSAHTDVPTHTHAHNMQGGTTGSNSGTNVMGSTATGGSARAMAIATSAPAGAVASQPHSGGAVDAHTVGQASQHGAQSHTNGAVASGTTDPAGYVAYVFERTA